MLVVQIHASNRNVLIHLLILLEMGRFAVKPLS